MTVLEFDIWDWTRACLHHDPDALAWMASLAPPNTVVGPVQLVAEGRVAVHTLPPRDCRDRLTRADGGRIIGWVTTRRVHATDRPIPPQVAALFHPSKVSCPHEMFPGS